MVCLLLLIELSSNRVVLSSISKILNANIADLTPLINNRVKSSLIGVISLSCYFLFGFTISHVLITK